jgi:hypothetical protein
MVDGMAAIEVGMAAGAGAATDGRGQPMATLTRITPTMPMHRITPTAMHRIILMDTGRINAIADLAIAPSECTTSMDLSDGVFGCANESS